LPIQGGRLEYVIDVKDETAYAALKKFDAAMDAHAGKQKQAWGTVGDSSTKAGNQISSSMKNAGDSVAKHGKDMHTTLGMIEWRLKYLAMSTTVYAGMAGIGALTAGFTAATVAGIQFDAMMEQSTIAMTSMLGSAAAAGDMLTSLYAMAAKSPFKFPEFVTGAQRLIAYGVAAKDVEKTLRAIGDATAAVGGSSDVFNRMSFSIGQMVSMGKITAREMREVAMAGVPAWDILAKAMGKSVAELQKISETTGIAAEVGIPALITGIEDRFGGMMEKMSDTWSGLTTTTQDQLKQMAGIAEAGIFDTLKDKLKGIRDWLAEFNAEAKKFGFMTALKNEAPGVYEAIRTIEASLAALADAAKAVGTVFNFLATGGVTKFFLELAAGTLIVMKLGTGLVALKNGFMALSTVKAVSSILQTALAMRSANIAMETGAMLAPAYATGMAGIGTALGTIINPATLAVAAIAALGYAYVLNKRHQEDLKKQTDALVESTKTLTESMGGTWGEVVVAQYRGATVASKEFGERNAALINQIKTLKNDTAAAGAKAIEISYEMQLHGIAPEEIVKTVQALFDAADVTLPVKVGAASPEEYVEAAKVTAAKVKAAWDAQLAQADRLGGGWEGSKPFQAAKMAADAESRGLGMVAAQGFTTGYLESIKALISAPEFQMAAQAFATELGDPTLAKANFKNMSEFMTQALGSNVTKLREFAEAYRDALAGGDAKSATAFQQGTTAADAFAAAITKITREQNNSNDSTDAAAQAQEDLKSAIEETTKAWAKELEAQYDMGGAYNKALKAKQAALNEAAAEQNAANQKAAEAEKKSIDTQADAAIAALEKVRDARLADLKEQEAEWQKKATFGASSNTDLMAQISQDHVKALQDEQNAVTDQAAAEKEAIQARATAQKDAIEAVKVSAEEAALSIGEITQALADAASQADAYLLNLTQLPQDVRDAIRDSGLTAEQKQQLAEELVAGSQADRDRAFKILRDMAKARSDESATAWAEYDVKMSALAGSAGQNIVDALVTKLNGGTAAIDAAINGYGVSLALALNPILKALGAPEMPVVTNRDERPFGGNMQWTQQAHGGIMLPSQATIQPAVSPRGLVQWAEPQTKGEAFIPLAPDRRSRSIGIWAQTGRILGVYAQGGFRKYAGGGFGDFTGGSTRLSYTSDQEQQALASSAEYARATAAASVYAAELANLVAKGASAAAQQAKLNQQLAAIQGARDAKQAYYDLQKALGATDEQLAALKVDILGLDTQLATLNPVMDAAAEATRFWGAAAAQTATQMQILADSSASAALQLALLPQLMQQLGQQFEAQMEQMRNAATPEAIQGYAAAALASLTAMFNASKAALQNALDATNKQISDAQADWTAAWTERGSVMEAELKKQEAAINAHYAQLQKAENKRSADLSRALNDEIRALTKFYDDQLAVMDAKDREITRAQQRNKARVELGKNQDALRILQGQGYYTEGDIAKMRELEGTIQDEKDAMAQQDAAWAREDARRKLEEQKNNALDALRAQQEAEQVALQDQIDAANASLEAQKAAELAALDDVRAAHQAEKDEADAHFQKLREDAQAAYQAALDALVKSYSDQMQAVIDQENKLLGEQSKYHGAGYTLGAELAKGVRDSIPLIEQAGIAAADALARYLELHSPAKAGPLADLDKWLEAFVPTIMTPFKGGDVVGSTVSSLHDMVGATKSEQHIYVHLDGDARGLDVRELSTMISEQIDRNIHVVQGNWS
jgi:tape measure domain-containing protein